jgi:hypothetical protein
MPNIEGALVSLFANDPVVPTIVASRVFPIVMPIGSSFPSLVYQRISTPRWNALDDAAGTPHARFQFTCWAATMNEVIALSQAVKDALAGFVGWSEGINIGQALLVDTRDSWLWEAGQQLGLYRRDLDFEIVWNDR